MPWGELDSRSLSWQQRRVERVLMQQEVHVAVDLQHEGGEQAKSAAGFPAVGFIHPLNQSWAQRIASLFLSLRLAVLEYFRPAQDDDGGNLKRVEMMLTNHLASKSMVESITKKPAWYIEVVAVDPSYQKRRLGSQMVEHLLSLCPPDHPVYLECTDRKNVGFYEKYGFKVVTEVRLIDPLIESDEGLRLWLMAKL
ncbi:hypothetical protein N8I77_011038 [Diaporthe amygdali]|uniref:N-acetyltransferase domain-containing protein n=1 Tax=Phomopsis amygdali TaxID=1214568 RepID=A0AAD9VY28_PHOAM|nr:hypothetical protein N8I77_011038 [Diaporthe amygdali]